MMYAVSRLLQLGRGSELEARALLAVVLSLELSDRRIDDVVIVVHDLVDDATRSELDDAVSYRLDELMVMAGEEDIALEDLQRVVEGLDALQVEVVRGTVEY